MFLNFISDLSAADKVFFSIIIASILLVVLWYLLGKLINSLSAKKKMALQKEIDDRKAQNIENSKIPNSNVNIEESQNKEVSQTEETPDTLEETQNEEAPDVVEEAQVEEAPNSVEEAQTEEAPDALEETQVEEAPDALEEAQAEETPDALEEAQAEEAPDIVEEAQAEETPDTVEETQAEETPDTVEEAQAEETPDTVEETQAEEALDTVEETQVEEAPDTVEEAQAEEALDTVEETQVEETPDTVEEAQAEETPDAVEVAQNKPALPTKRNTKKTIVAPSNDAIKPQVQTEEKKGRNYNGKYEIYQVAGGYAYHLKASNGEILVVSETFSTREGAVKAIDVVKKNLETGTIKFFSDKKGKFKFKLVSKNYRVLLISSNYPTEKGATRASESFKKFAVKADIVDIELVDAEAKTATVIQIQNKENKTGGKYHIEKYNGEFSWDLKASNGQILCQADGYTTKSGCLNSIESFKKSVQEGVFKCVKDKTGRYCFKLYSTTGRICLVGESYTSRSSAESAANSVAAFSQLAEIVEIK